jgi:coenzyme F420-reducing hydrogenase delta subunit
MGCGACALVCPHSAIQVEGFEFESSLRNYMEIATELKGSSGNPLVLAFVCQWSEFNALDMPHSLFKKHIYCMEVPCFKALDPVHISNALSNGFDGVIGVVCSEEDCKLQEGRELAERNMGVLKNYLKKVGLIDRFELLTMSPRQVGDFSQKLEAFVQRLNSLQAQKPNERRVCADS